MVFTILSRVPRGRTNAAGIRMTLFREALARAIEEASLSSWGAFVSAALANATTGIGLTPASGAKADSVQVHVVNAGTGTVDVQVDGVSILTAPIDLNGKAAGSVTLGTLTDAAKAGLAASKRISVVTTAGTASAVTIDCHLKTVHNST